MQNILNTNFLVDTNILLYGYDNNSPYHKAASELIVEAAIKGIGFVAFQNLAEFANVAHKSFSMARSDIIENLDHIRKDFQVINPKSSTLDVFMRLLGTVSKEKLDIFDYFLAATMLDNNIHTIVTNNDKDFAAIPGVTVYNPWK